MASLHESYLAGFGFDIATPELKTDYRSAALVTAPLGQANMHACIYMCVHAQVCACLSVGRSVLQLTTRSRRLDLVISV